MNAIRVAGELALGLAGLTLAWGFILLCVAVLPLGIAVVIGTLLYTVCQD